MLVYSQSTSSEIGLTAWKESHEIPNLSQAVKTFWKKTSSKRNIKHKKNYIIKSKRKKDLRKWKCNQESITTDMLSVSNLSVLTHLSNIDMWIMISYVIPCQSKLE